VTKLLQPKASPLRRGWKR